ncbi:MAG: lytic transglycosylase domain-containing protein [Pseudomonadota bacterium]
MSHSVRTKGAYAYLPRLFGALLVAFAFTAPVTSKALDLATARSDGALVSDALDIARSEGWDAAQAFVSAAHPVVQDIVLWRKLRAGKGTTDEFQAYMSRRPTWPGQSVLNDVVYGRTSGSSGSLSGQAQENWRTFRTLMRQDRYEEAETAILNVTGTRAGLGDPEVWAKRRLSLARRAAREGRWLNAYNIASQHFLTTDAGYNYSDSEWVSGWVALRKLKDPARAITHFRRFRESVETPISLGRGGYWLGRAYEAAGQASLANRWYADAAQYQTSFYGQLAAAKVSAPGDRQLTLRELPDWRTHPMTQNDDVRLAATLFYAGQDRLAMATFSRLGENAPIGALAPLTRLVMDLGQPHYAVRIAKKAARRGVLIYPAYYPVHELGSYATKVEAAFALSIARQETELNPRAISRAGARGLMQLMPATARRVAGWIGEEYSRSRLLTDWQYNARLGETYLSRRTSQFGGSYVMAAAAYNAGAGRVDQWIDAYGDPRLGEIDMIDWMEQIPFNETRNYVQRVMEGLYVYRTRLSGTAGPMTIVQDLSRGVR